MSTLMKTKTGRGPPVEAGSVAPGTSFLGNLQVVTQTAVCKTPGMEPTPAVNILTVLQTSH